MNVNINLQWVILKNIFRLITQHHSMQNFWSRMASCVLKNLARVFCKWPKRVLCYHPAVWWRLVYMVLGYPAYSYVLFAFEDEEILRFHTKKLIMSHQGNFPLYKNPSRYLLSFNNFVNQKQGKLIHESCTNSATAMVMAVEFGIPVDW